MNSDRWKLSQEFAQYHMYCFSCLMMGVPHKTFDEWLIWINSFECWYPQHWWCEDWEDRKDWDDN